MNREFDCQECRDSGYVRDWEADTESGYGVCKRPGCYAAEQINAAVERELALESDHG